MVKQAIYLRFILGAILFFTVACNGEKQIPTVTPTSTSGAQPTTELSSTPTLPAVPSTEALVPTATGESTPTQTIALFTESGGVYSVNLTSADFVDVVDNPYFPLPLGAKWEYEIREGGKATQTDTLEVLKEK